jgi:opacity protein-like surface antigen
LSRTDERLTRDRQEETTMDRAKRNTLRLLDRILIGTFLLLAMLLIGLGAARAAEIVPSIGVSRSTSGDGELKRFAGLAVRGSVLPMVKSEIGVAYRNEPYYNGDLNVKMYPVTASLWISPLPTLYFGGGAGWYYTTFDYKESLGLQDETSQEFGTHLGGGLTIPVVPAIASVDLNGRYVKMRDKDSPLAPGAVKQSFWTTTLGLAIKF